MRWTYVHNPASTPLAAESARPFGLSGIRRPRALRPLTGPPGTLFGPRLLGRRFRTNEMGLYPLELV